MFTFISSELFLFKSRRTSDVHGLLEKGPFGCGYFSMMMETNEVEHLDTEQSPITDFVKQFQSIFQKIKGLVNYF